LPSTTETDRLRIMWSAFSSDGPPDDEFWRRMSAPDNEIPVAVPLNVVLARTDDVAIALLGLQVYTTGLEFDLACRVRSGLRGRDLSELVFEHGRRTEGRLLLGVGFADGRRISNVEGRGPESDVVFHPGGGGGGDRSVDQSWWMSPLPPDGPLTFVVDCAALGVTETSTVIDGSLIARAAAGVVTLWPWNPPDHGDHGPPPPPDLPAGSWFGGT
jgi:hypothetical protein